jgi:hypothetical protein
MAFLRHVGKHGDRKVAIVFREVPGEPHMALVVYTEILNRNIHDPLVQCIESDIGQSSEDLALALNRTYTTDGQIILQKLHAEGMLKKVQTELIVMTPTPNTRIKLNELNKILDEMKQGEEAVKKMAELDSQMGMQDPAAVARRMRGDKVPELDAAPIQAASGDALGDAALAANLRQQAERMSSEAKGLIAEANRLIEQARSLDPAVAKSSPSIDATPVKTRGRPKKTPVTVA